MAEKAIPARVAMPLALAAAAGCASSAVLPYVGLPIVAAATAALLAQGGFALAIGAVMTGAAVAVVMGPWDIVFALPGGLATVLAVRALRTRDVQPVGGVLGLVVVGAAAGTDALRAASAGQTLASSISDTAEASAKALSSILGGAASTEQIDAASKLLVHLWPSAYVQTAVFTVVFAIGAATWAARRSGLPLERVKPMAQLDLSAHVLWGLIVGLVLMALARVTGGADGLVNIVGINLLMATRFLFFIQGLAVFSAIIRKLNLGAPGRAATYVVLFVFDSLLFAVSLIGMLDFWANFRRLDRGSGTPDRLDEPAV